MTDNCPLKSLEAIHLKVVEASPDAKIVIDENGKVIVFNAKAELLFGLSRQDVIGRDIEMLMPERFREPHKKFRSLFFDDPTTREMGDGRVLRGLRKSGQEFPIQIKLAPLLVENDGLFALAVVRRVKEVPTSDA